jgi:hypothetical protein
MVPLIMRAKVFGTYMDLHNFALSLHAAAAAPALKALLAVHVLLCVHTVARAAAKAASID